MNDTPPPVASPALESADMKTVLEFLEVARQRCTNHCLGCGTIVDYCNECPQSAIIAAVHHVNRLSARQAAFEAMREALKKLLNNLGTASLVTNKIGIKIREQAKAALALAEAEMKGEK